MGKTDYDVIIYCTVEQLPAVRALRRKIEKCGLSYTMALQDENHKDRLPVVAIKGQTMRYFNAVEYLDRMEWVN